MMTFEVGAALEDAKWQAPVYCFEKGNTVKSSSIISEQFEERLAKMRSLRGLRDKF